MINKLAKTIGSAAVTAPVLLHHADAWFIYILKKTSGLIPVHSVEHRNGTIPIRSGLLLKEISSISRITSVSLDVVPKIKRPCMPN